MDINENIKKTLKQNQEIFEASYKSLVIAHSHVEQMTASVFEQAQVPAESIKMLHDTFNECSITRDIIKKSVDDCYSSLNFFLK